MRRILIVEDEPSIRTLLSDMLRDEGYAVITAANGAEALELSRNFAPDIVLLDLWLPIMDGWAFLRERQRRHTLAAVPVLAMSADRERGLATARDLGATAVVAKPFDLTELLAMVERLVAAPAGQVLRTDQEVVYASLATS
jgi:two-component system chemotaxis response regulator CheY